MPATARPWSREEDAWQFVEALADLPAPAWLGAAGRAATSPGIAAELTRLARHDGVALVAWFLEEAIETAAWYSMRNHGRHKGRLPAGVGAAITAARVSALALLVRPRLGESRFRALYAPFAALVPAPADAERRTVFTGSLCAAPHGHGNLQGTHRSPRP